MIARMADAPATLAELTARHLELCPVWQVMEAGAGDIMRKPIEPRPEIETVSTDDGTDVFAVRTTFVFADGTQMIGFCLPTPPDQRILSYLVPTICAGGGQVPFWINRDVQDLTAPLDVEGYYAILGRTGGATFPATFESDVPVGPGEIASGTLEGFSFMLLQRDERRFLVRVVS